MDSSDSNVTYVTQFCDLNGGNVYPSTTPYTLRRQDMERVGHDCHGNLLNMTWDRFRKRLFGKGIVVKKMTSSGNGYRLRFLKYRNGYFIVSSLFSSKAIRISDIKKYEVLGMDIHLDTLEHGLIHLKMRVFMDNVAFKYLIRNLSGDNQF